MVSVAPSKSYTLVRSSCSFPSNKFYYLTINIMQEIWKPIKDYEWLYEVSSLWNIRNKSKIKNKRDWWWYSVVTLCSNWIKKSFLIHRLVAKAFIPNPEDKPQVNHKNWIKNDNSEENLEWCDRSYNAKHSYNILLRKSTWEWKKWYNHNCSITTLQYLKDWKFVKERWSLRSASTALWIDSWDISRCCNWKVKSAGWYLRKFI